MSREDFDIPEVFRRAMEEAGWEEGQGGDDGGRSPLPRRPGGRPRYLRWLILGAIVLAIVLSFGSVVNFYTDWLWYRELGYESVWFKQWLLRVGSFFLFFAIALGFFLVNWLLALRRARRDTSPFNPQLLSIPGVGLLVGAAAGFMALIFGSLGAGSWQDYLRFAYRSAYGATEPIFNLDIGFYLFQLPAYNALQGWILGLLFIALLGVIVIYSINNIPDIQHGQWEPHKNTYLRRHAALIGALFLGVWALGYWLDIYGLLYSTRGVAFGASYTDMNASLWALRLQMLFMGVSAVILLLNVFRLTVRPLLISLALWLAATILVGGLYPSFVQRYAVEPNEIVREQPYIDNNIRLTRLAFGLDKIETRTLSEVTELQQVDLNENEDVLRNVRLWDYRPLQESYAQLQALRPYYQFSEIDIDRYLIDGQERQVMLAARELNRANIPAPSWVNRNLEFTHGYGVVMNAVDQISPDGQPIFMLQDMPPQSTTSLEVTRPEIYYGELTNAPVFVGSAREEFSYPSGNENVYTSYEGTGGVPLDSLFKRIAFALRLSDFNVLLSDEIDSTTRLQFHRQVQDRIRRVAPFLALDRDPYLVVDDSGELYWLQDAYTLSNDFPYATPVGGEASGFNYIRNAAKITVNAYDGEVNFYLSDPEDPIVRAYDAAFPGLFQPLDAMPTDLRAHIRYPADLFRVQTRQYSTYHMQDTRVFYNKEDLWQIPNEIFDTVEQPMEPYYVTIELPGEAEPEYLLIQPFTPASKANMISWVAARNDEPHYGELVVYELSKQELVFGPMQVEGRIDQETEISQQFSLWDQRGSSIIRGNLIVIPINQTFLYVEPIYLLSDTNALPELKRVIVATDTRIAMRETLAESLLALIVETPAQVDNSDAAAIQAGEVAADAAEVVAPAGEPTPVPDSEAPVGGGALAGGMVAELVRSANQHFEAAEAAQRAGDWAAYGEELAALNRDLSLLLQVSAEEE